MRTDAVLTKRSQEEDWLPVLELAIQEVFRDHAALPGDASGAIRT
jgi:hypothetical protein